MSLQTVFVVFYEHKHGSDINVCATVKGAWRVAHGFAAERVEESWDDAPEIANFKLITDHEEAVGYFNGVELDTAYSENLEVYERGVIS